MKFKKKLIFHSLVLDVVQRPAKYFGVVAIEKGASGRQLYLYIYIYIYIYIYMEVNNGKESDSMEKIEKQSSTEIMKLLRMKSRR